MAGDVWPQDIEIELTSKSKNLDNRMTFILGKNRETVCMNKLTVLAKNKETYFIKRLTEEVGKYTFDILDPWTGPDLIPGNKMLLVRTTGVYGDDKDLQFLKGLDNSYKLCNSLEALGMFRSKKSQYELFGRIGIPQVPWINLLDTDLSLIISFIQNFPVPRYLIKPHRGQGGWGIKAMSASKIAEWYQNSSDHEYILQPCIDGAREYRAFFIGENSWTLERLKATGRVAANFQLEGEARRVDSDSRFEKIIRRIRTANNVHYAALDILEIENEIFVLELNVVPGIQQLEKVTGENIIRKLLESLNIE